MIELFNTIIYEPLYNGFIFLLGIIPGADVGITLIILTLLVRFILLPLSHKSVASQAKMKEIAPEIQKVKEQHKNDKQEQARKTMELYQKHGINPFSGCVSVLIQIPIVIGLFFVFFKGLPTIDSGALYSFIAIPEYINTHFLGIIDLAGKSAVLAVLAGGTQYFQMKLSMPPAPPLKNTEKKMSFKEELGRSMNIQMRYILPFIVFFVALSISGAVALYWTTSNTFSISHEYLVRRKADRLAKNNPDAPLENKKEIAA